VSELEQRVNARRSPRVPARRGGRARLWASPPRHSRAAKTRVWDFRQRASINLKVDAPRTPRSYRRISRRGYEVASKVTLGARDYDPRSGRWISKDPIRFHGGVNLYAYSGSDPVNFIDRTGRGPEVIGGVAGPLLPVAAAAGAAYLGIYCALHPDVCGAAINKAADWITDMCKAPIEAVKDTDEECYLEAEVNWSCIYYCPKSGTTEETLRGPRGQAPPANDVCPPTIRLTD